MKPLPQQSSVYIAVCSHGQQATFREAVPVNGRLSFVAAQIDHSGGLPGQWVLGSLGTPRPSATSILAHASYQCVVGCDPKRGGWIPLLIRAAESRLKKPGAHSLCRRALFSCLLWWKMRPLARGGERESRRVGYSGQEGEEEEGREAGAGRKRRVWEGEGQLCQKYMHTSCADCDRDSTTGSGKKNVASDSRRARCVCGCINTCRRHVSLEPFCCIASSLKVSPCYAIPWPAPPRQPHRWPYWPPPCWDWCLWNCCCWLNCPACWPYCCGCACWRCCGALLKPIDGSMVSAAAAAAAA